MPPSDNVLAAIKEFRRVRRGRYTIAWVPRDWFELAERLNREYLYPPPLTPGIDQPNFDAMDNDQVSDIFANWRTQLGEMSQAKLNKRISPLLDEPKDVDDIQNFLIPEVDKVLKSIPSPSKQEPDVPSIAEVPVISPLVSPPYCRMDVLDAPPPVFDSKPPRKRRRRRSTKRKRKTSSKRRKRRSSSRRRRRCVASV